MDDVAAHRETARVDALRAAACLAVDAAGLGGAVLRTDLGASTDAWLALLRRLLPEAQSVRRVPTHVDEERLLGGIDLAATLRTGRAMRTRGLLEDAGDGILLLSMVERMRPPLAARIAQALDSRSGVAAASSRSDASCRFGVVALDTSRLDDERCPRGLLDRLAIHVDLTDLHFTPADAVATEPQAIPAARRRLPGVTATDAQLRALCVTALGCGVVSLRPPRLALQLARISAALAERGHVDEDDLEFAARMVIAPRALCMPAPPEEAAAEPDAQASAEPADDPPTADAGPPPEAHSADTPGDDGTGGTLQDRVVAAVRAAVPAGTLAAMAEAAATRARVGGVGRSGALVHAGRRGRPAGVRAAHPRNGLRLNVLATLRAAAPWQRLRRQSAPVAHRGVHVRADDFRVTWFRQRNETVTIFVIDASGSSALHRLAEVKGAVELLLAECYVRRDQVAVLAFRGKGADVVLAPTRSLLRAKRGLANLPGGGATPLAAGIDAARLLAEQVRRQGQTPSVVLMTDGQANVSRQGMGGRPQAEADALLAARALRASGIRCLLIDTAPRPQAQASRIAAAMHAHYQPLPYADARAVAAAVAVQNAG